MSVRLEQADQTVAEQEEVFGHYNSHGTVKVTRVGPPVGLSMSI